MRRRITKEYSWSGGAWLQTNEVRYIYDHRVVLQDRYFLTQPVTTMPQQTITYTRGNDLEAHPNSGLVYYLYRFYDPGSQGWLNRDPLGSEPRLANLMFADKIDQSSKRFKVKESDFHGVKDRSCTTLDEKPQSEA